MIDTSKFITREERRKQRRRERYNSDPEFREHIREYQRKWGMMNRTKTAEYTRRARAKRKNADERNVVSGKFK